MTLPTGWGRIDPEGISGSVNLLAYLPQGHYYSYATSFSRIRCCGSSKFCPSPPAAVDYHDTQAPQPDYALFCMPRHRALSVIHRTGTDS